jgi:hypothetical protein
MMQMMGDGGIYDNVTHFRNYTNLNPKYIEKVLKCSYIKYHHISCFDLKCMNYDLKKGRNQIENLTLDHKSF